MLTSDKEVVQLVVDQCKLHDVKTIVFSPGSRNSPFAIAFDEDDYFNTFVIHDERSAAFFALGMSQENKELVALCCTSGSALLNYYPAISEAYYRSIPLLVISADRPSSWIDQGDGQTIRQKQVFQQHARAFFQLDDIQLTEDTLWYYLRETSILFNQLKKGPVHLNVSLNEPLYNLIEKKRDFSKKISFITSSNSLHLNDIQLLKSLLLGKKIMVICGQMNANHSLQKFLELFANNTGAIVLAEHTSNLTNISFISCVDRVLNMMEDYSVYQPEVVIHIGGAIVSKRIKTFLRRNNALEVLRIDETELIEDTFKHLTTHLSISPESFFEQFKDFTSESRSNFFGKWKQKDLTAQDNCHSVSAELKGLNDWYCFYLIHQYFQENTVIHMGNSSVVRYMQLFDVVKGCNYYGNRGTSGIDGSFSTAVGAAVASPEKNHLFVCGDVSFLYDHNALWIEKFPNNLKVIIIHNSGGGIFKIIEGAKDSTKSSTYFEAKHSQEVTPIIKAFHKRAQQVCSAEYLELHLQAFLTFGNDDIQFLEIKTEAESNPHVLTNFFNKIK